ncbi:MAG: hypothetical protein HKN37_13670 [Rhodothermales bacterium]|nr:hypothetical protein [Rhodothermales bacterium]
MNEKIGPTVLDRLPVVAALAMFEELESGFRMVKMLLTAIENRRDTPRPCNAVPESVLSVP